MNTLTYLAKSKLNDLTVSSKKELTLTDLQNAFVLGAKEIIELVEERSKTGDGDLPMILWELQLIKENNN